MKKVCVVQSRMANARMPGKNGLMLMGKPQIWHVLKRIQRCQTFSEIILAIPHESNGGPQKEVAQELGIPVLDYKGDYTNVVHRYCIAADIMDGDIIIRIPGDNTFVDPDIVDHTVEVYDKNPPRWNHLLSSLDDFGEGHPAGLGCEVWDVRFLQWLDGQQLSKRQREHPHTWAIDTGRIEWWTPYPWLDYHLIKWLPHKFSVDTPEDWEFTKRIYEALYPAHQDGDFRIASILSFLGETNVK